MNNPEYDVPAYTTATKYVKEAKLSIAEAKRQDTKGGRYDLVTVLFAAALFVFGISNVIRRWGIQLGVTGLGLAIFLGSVIQLGRITWG